MSIAKASTRLPACLLSLRLTVFLVFFMWTLDKFVNPQHASTVYENFYFIGGLGNAAFVVIGILEVLLILAFVAGLYKTWTYGLVFALHAVSTLSSWQFYLGFDNLLFFAAWPMLAASWTLLVMREEDTMWTLGDRTGRLGRRDEPVA
ncbi:MAG: hypothetical protein WDZ76_13360 [Pseudohongiellaceae bacterium]